MFLFPLSYDNEFLRSKILVKPKAYHNAAGIKIYIFFRSQPSPKLLRTRKLEYQSQPTLLGAKPPPHLYCFTLS